MLSNFSPQYAPQGLYSPQMPQWPQMSTPYGQPGAFGGYAPFGHELGQVGIPQLQNPFAQNPSALSPFAPNSFAGFAGAPHPAQQVILVLAQLAQQIAVQSAVIQQTCIAVQQLAYQLAAQSHPMHQGQPNQGQPFLGVGQSLGAPFLGGLGAQYFGQNPFANTAQGAYGGYSPQAQGQPWGVNRPTIQ